jgi:hypothetical protein
MAFDQEFWDFSIAEPLSCPLYHACTLQHCALNLHDYEGPILPYSQL